MIRTEPFELKPLEYLFILYRTIFRGILVVVVGLLIVIGLSVIFPANETSESWFLNSSVEILLLVLCCVMTVPLFLFFKTKKTLTQERRMSFSKEGLQLMANQIDAKIGWVQIQRIKRGRKHIYIYLDFQSFWIVPLSAFRNPEDILRFEALAHEAQVKFS